MLGPLEALDEGRPVPLGGAKPRTVLAVLLLNANRMVPSAQLADALWGENPPETAATALHVYVSRLRKVLPEGMLVTKPPGYLLQAEADSIDLARFERLAAEGRGAMARGDAAAAAERLRDALALWQGPALADVELEAYAHAEVLRLEELRDAVLEDRIEADLALGRDAELIGELEALVARNPLRERLRGHLMLALYRAGRQADALEAYRAARTTLGDELGIEPSTALQRLHTAILRQASELEPATAETPIAVPERKVAAIVFAVVGPADDGEEDAADVRALLERLYEAAASELREAGAVVERGLAGALLARFDEDPGRALQAALALRTRLSEQFGASVRLRIGVELGEVLRVGTSVTGVAVATAARLAGSAGPGKILVGERVAAATHGAFELSGGDAGYELVGARL